MTPLQKIAMGLVIVVVDTDHAGFDLIPDLLGWLLVLLGVSGLRSRLPGFTAIAASVALSALVSLALLRADWTADLPASTAWLLSLPQLVFTILLCGALATLSAGTADDVRQRYTMLRWGFLALAAAPVVVYGAGVDALVGPLAVATVVAHVYLIYLLFRTANHAYVVPARVE